MKVAVIPCNDELRAGVIFRASDYADRILVITSNETVERLARIAGAEVIKQKDYDIINAIYLGLKKVKEMRGEPLVILEDPSKDEKILISSLLKDAEFIIESEYTSKDGVRQCDIFDFEDNNYKRVILGYELKDPNLPEKVFYVVWSLVLGFRIAIRRLWRRVRH